MPKSVIVGDLRVQEVRRPAGRVEYTIMSAAEGVHPAADRFLRQMGGGTDRTYAYLLVDHLRWLVAEGLAVETVEMGALERYMGALGAEYRGPVGAPWRTGRPPYGASALLTTAACLKAFYRSLGAQGINERLSRALDVRRLPTQRDRNISLLGHVMVSAPANPLAPKAAHRRKHPKLPPDGATAALLNEASSSRDRLLLTWLADGGFRVGEVCGLHLSDLHLRANSECGESRAAHVHICHRDDNPNRARVKTKVPWSRRSDGVVIGGTIRLASPAMVHTYFEYMGTDYPEDCDHGLVLVHTSEKTRGKPLTTDGARSIVARLAEKAGLGDVTPHAFRHQFATDVLHAASGNTSIAREAGGWASAATVEQVYAHIGPDDRILVSALSKFWESR